MIEKLFKKATIEDLKKELQNKVFNESKVNSLAKSVDIKQYNDKNQTLLHEMALKNRTESLRWLYDNGLVLDVEDNDGNTALSIACNHGYVDSIKTLLELGANPQYLNRKKRVPLQDAARSGNFDAYYEIRKNCTDASFSNIDKEGQTVVYDALFGQNPEILEDLLLATDPKMQIDTQHTDNEGRTPLHFDEAYRSEQITKVLLHNGYTPDLKDKKGRNALFYLIHGSSHVAEIFEEILDEFPQLFNHKDTNGDTLLIHAVRHMKQLFEEDNHTFDQSHPMIQFIHIMSENGINSKSVNSKGESAISLAIESKNREFLEFLLNNEISPDIQNKDGNTPLSIEALKGKAQKEIVSLLIDYGADPNIKDNEQQTIIEKLIEAELNVTNNKKIPARIKRVIDEEHGNYFSILEEIVLNSDVNLRQLNSHKQPYFFDAALYNNVAIVKLLVYYGADINQTNDENLNIIYKLMQKGAQLKRESELKQYYSTLRAIISYGADVNARDDFGGITLHKAILSNDIQTVKILISSGADILSIDNRGRNMLHNTIWNNRLKLLRLIYSHNKNLLNMEDKFGVLPIHYAAFLGYTELILELINLGAHVNSPVKKAPYILKFLERFHKNIPEIIKKARNKSDKLKIHALVENMREEFQIPTHPKSE